MRRAENGCGKTPEEMVRVMNGKYIRCSETPDLEAFKGL